MGAVNAIFLAFAERMKRWIASPVHLALFLVLSLAWLLFAIGRGFDPFSQLVLNTPTTWAEYVFEVLVLAAAISADAQSGRAIQAIAEHQEYVRRQVDQLRADLTAVVREETRNVALESDALERLVRIERLAALLAVRLGVQEEAQWRA